jgi:predicted transposase/invertase (TIGR01784 family)
MPARDDVLAELGFTAKWEARGREEGIEKGIEKGREKGMKEAAMNLLNYGMSPEKIAKVLKLPLDEVMN